MFDEDLQNNYVRLMRSIISLTIKDLRKNNYFNYISALNFVKSKDCQYMCEFTNLDYHILLSYAGTEEEQKEKKSLLYSYREILKNNLSIKKRQYYLSKKL
ncbi:hypothetical protein [Methanobrevibacter sp.]|uniref:hypothetical protein n=1 Tax=Methanobrevibacter sp. TaxID=66852 RepID=UPI00388F7925